MTNFQTENDGHSKNRFTNDRWGSVVNRLVYKFLSFCGFLFLFTLALLPFNYWLLLTNSLFINNHPDMALIFKSR